MAEKKCLQSFGRKPEEWKPLVRTKRKWKHRYVIKMVFTEMGWDSVDWVHVAQDREQCRAFLFCALLYDATELYSAEWKDE
jgi:hypothetical protein